MSDERFSGGDNLAPGSMEYYAHRAMMSNELSGGNGAYRISNAGLASSGPSFGPFQYDVGANAHGRQLLEGIAGAARDDEGRPLLSAADVRQMKDHLYKPFNEFTPQDREVYDRLKPKLDLAVGSAQGVAAVNADYIPQLEAKVRHVNDVAAGIPNAQNKAFVEGSPLAKMIVLDTANQYGGKVNDGLKEFMGRTRDDPAMPMPGRKPPATIKVEGDFGLEDMIRYKLETQYGQTDAGAKDVLRRMSNLVDAVGVDTVKASLTVEDRKFLETGLTDYLKEHGRDPRILDAKELRALNELAGRSVDHPSPSRTHASTPHVLHEGSSGRDVTQLQQNLSGLGMATGAQAGQYDAVTKAAVEGFQRTHGLTADGKAGPKTQEALTAEIGRTQKELGELGYKGNGKPLVADGDHGSATADALKAFQREYGIPASGVADEATRSAVHAASAQARASTQAAASPPAPTPRLDSPDHPGNGFYKEALAHVHDIDARLGRTPDERSANLAGGLAVQARADGLQRIDAVALSDDGSRLWAVEQPNGRTDHLFDKQTSVPTAMANVPLEQSSQQWSQAMEQTQARSAAQTQTHSQQQQQTPMSL